MKEKSPTPTLPKRGGRKALSVLGLKSFYGRHSFGQWIILGQEDHGRQCLRSARF
jgi:hypothetical protein